MSDARADWICKPDDGSTRAEISVLPGEVVVCLWRCEDKLEEMQKYLEENGLKLQMEWQGACRHEVLDERRERK
ncbi:MAG: hypothetical protein ACREX3_18685 [Gammaproteobacteria bacterium]